MKNEKTTYETLLKQVKKDLGDAAYKNHESVPEFFEKMLECIVQDCCSNYECPREFTPELHNAFHLLFIGWCECACAGIQERRWVDIPGTIYEEIAAMGDKKHFGQFFTPEHICELMTRLTCQEEHPAGQSINDPACGSGRNLLCFNALNPGKNYFVGQDLDRTCVLMTLINFFLHGVVGEVIWGNTLTMEIRQRFIVNDRLYKAGDPFQHIPHCRIARD